MGKRIIGVIVLIGVMEVIGTWLVKPVNAQTPGLGLGVCHWPGTAGLANSSVTWFYWGGGGGQEWKQLEPTSGTYSFTAFDSELANIFTSKPNTAVWLNIYTSDPTVAPAWAKPAQNTVAACSVNDIHCNPYGYIQTGSVYASFAPWNVSYQNKLRGLLNAVSAHLDSSSFHYRDKIKGVIVMAGGYFGEMIVYHDSTSTGYQEWIAAGYTDAVYKQALVDVIVPMYINAFGSWGYPLIIQLGSGLNGSSSFTRSVIDDIYTKYPTMRGRIYYKYNSWSKTSWSGTSLVTAQQSKHNVLKDASVYTRVGWEPGVGPAGDDPNLLFTNITQSINYSHASFFCLQDGYYSILSSAQIAQIDNLLEGNSTPTPTGSITSTPTPTITITITPTLALTPTLTPPPTPVCASQKLIGDYDCSGIVDGADFDAWKTDFVTGAATLSYFEYWRRAMSW